MNQVVPVPAMANASPLWWRSIGWLLFLGPFFFLSYGFANHIAAARGVTDSVVFDWERRIPFLPWSIVPYWSIDLLYGLSFLLCRTRPEVDRHALRLLTAQIISISFFLIFPLRFTFGRPHVDGLFGGMFDALMSFDQPYNQAPSLHISLLVILWVRFATAVPGRWRAVVHIWTAIIGLSVLTTFQHHFIDIPTGVLAGFICLWIWPDAGSSPLVGGNNATTTRHHRLTACYLFGAVVLAAIAVSLGGAALWLWWGAAALGLVALVYFRTGAAAGFQKEAGRHSMAVAVLLAPYVLGAWLNSRWWTRHHSAPDAIIDDVWLGRLPSPRDMHSGGFFALCDLAAELPAPRGNWHYVGLPWLDLVAPNASQLAEAARHIESLRVHGRVLVCCALGYSRSACAVAAWLLLTRRAADVDAALVLLRSRRPQLVLGPMHRAALSELMYVGGVDGAHV